MLRGMCPLGNVHFMLWRHHRAVGMQGVPARVNDEVFIAMAKALNFIDVGSS